MFTFLGTWTCAEGEVLCSDGSCMPTHDEHGCHNHCIVECSEDEQLCLGQAGHDHHEGHEHDRDFHDHGDCAEPDFCIHKDRKNFFFKNRRGKIQNMNVGNIISV